MIHPYIYVGLPNKAFHSKGSLRSPVIHKEAWDYIHKVCTFYNITLRDLKSDNRYKNFTRARHMISYLLTNHTELTLEEIGGLLNKNHSTIVYAKSKIRDYLDIGDKSIINEINQILQL